MARVGKAVWVGANARLKWVQVALAEKMETGAREAMAGEAQVVFPTRLFFRQAL